MTDYTPEALEALSKKATQGPEEYAAFVNVLFDAYRTGQLIHAVPSGDEVEAVARELAGHMEGGREYDQMPATRRELKIWSRNGMALINDATQEDAREAATAAITALDAHRGKQACLKARENGDGNN